MILVTGATGKVGSHALELLSRDDAQVRALVRDPSRLPADVTAEVVVGDLDDPPSLVPAVDGVDTVVLISPPSRAGEIAVIDAARSAGVGHIVKITSSASADSPVDRRRDQAAIEQHLAESGLPHTLLRANAYLQNLLMLAPSVRASDAFAMSTGDGRLGLVDARDVAAVAVQVALAPAPATETVHWLTGPAEVGYDDVARVLSEILGRRVEYRSVTPSEHLAMMTSAGLPEAVARSNVQAFELVASGDAAWTTDEVRALTGRDPVGLETFLREHAAAFGG